MAVLDRLRVAAGGPVVARSYGGGGWWEQWQQQLQFAFGGLNYPTLNTLYTSGQYEELGHGLEAYAAGLAQSPPAFGAQLVRSLVLAQAGFQFRRRDKSRRDRFWSSNALDVLEAPWPKGTTGELLSKMEWHDGLAGNAFVYRNDTLRRLYVPRPDWMTIVHGSQSDTENPQWQLDSEVVGYLYHPGGRGNGTPWVIPPEKMAHWSPLPDPLAPERGMSWMTPIIRELDSDIAATEHKVQYFRNGATPNLVVNGIPAKSPEEFEMWVDKIEEGHTGVRNAYRTLYLTAGSDATVVGSSLKDTDYKALQGASETRISVASRVPAPVLGISEGLAGSSLNAGNYGQSRRNFADIWLYPTLQSVTGALAQIVDVPSDSRLWHDTDDMPFLREDAKDAAEIQQLQASTITTLVREGYTADSAKAAVVDGDLSLLEHTGQLSVQLQKPGANANDSGGS